jgi:hypothetical protein
MPFIGFKQITAVRAIAFFDFVLIMLENNKEIRLFSRFIGILDIFVY